MIKKPKSDPPSCVGDIRAMNDTLEALGGKWKLLIVHYLLLRDGENNTFKKIEKDIEGISAKMLSKELKSLEANEIVTREVMKTKPITVKYNITEYGKSIKSIISILVDWGQSHRLKLYSL